MICIIFDALSTTVIKEFSSTAVLSYVGLRNGRVKVNRRRPILPLATRVDASHQSLHQRMCFSGRAPANLAAHSRYTRSLGLQIENGTLNTHEFAAAKIPGVFSLLREHLKVIANNAY